MQLPGGVVENGVRRREWAFRPISGALELALAEAGETAASTPEAVTHALSLALRDIGGEDATPQRVAQLCVADRQVMMRELEAHLGHASGGSKSLRPLRRDFRFPSRLRRLAGASGAGLPLAKVDIAGQCEFRLPNGADQAAPAFAADMTRPWLIQQWRNHYRANWAWMR